MRFGEAPPHRNGAQRNGVAEEESASPDPLSPDATVDVDGERRATDTDEILDGLDRELVGLVPVKTRIRETAALLLVDRLRQANRIVSAGVPVGRSDLLRIEPEDFTASRVLADDEEA